MSAQVCVYAAVSKEGVYFCIVFVLEALVSSLCNFVPTELSLIFLLSVSFFFFFPQ